MSKIDYQALREAAVAIETVATPQKLLAFRMKVTPQVVLALLDERDALNERLAELEADLAGLAEDHQKATESIKQADAAVKLAHEKFSALAAENAMLKQRTQQLIDIISNTDNDYCMCGSAMKDHVHSGCGYPTGMFDYYYNQWLESDNKTPATDAFLAEVKTEARKEGAYFVANRMLAAWEAGFIDDTAKNAADIARMILTSTEFMANAPEGDFDRSFSDGVLEDIAAQLRKGVAL
ncbi:ead/Ea22-like family protein [Escherichia coli]|uniref:ead/Ea22-like family protein n=1 Tax=Escherichia coli TaxID=562 RepID=UPI001073035E|nr:ead/Ea22-like family protein [Escherichia coli]EKX2131030.1 ead/Ea22-like family protein [Escherichia coli]TFS17380.1 ead/Ea22-like family protein [Escherichia coli]